MKTFTLINLLLEMTCTIEASDLSTAKGYAMDLASSRSDDNDKAYWINKRDYHTADGFKDVSRYAPAEAPAPMHHIKATLRVEKISGTISLFYFDEYRDLVAFNFSEGHCSASYNYYRCDTLPAHIHATPDNYALALKEFTDAYLRSPEPIAMRIVKRITTADNLA